MNVTTIAQKYGLTSTYETLEGHAKLDNAKLIDLVSKYSVVLAQD
jgi:hypothetical protein